MKVGQAHITNVIHGLNGLIVQILVDASVGCFQGSSEVPISVSYESSEHDRYRTEKELTGRGPGGSVEMGGLLRCSSVNNPISVVNASA